MPQRPIGRARNRIWPAFSALLLLSGCGPFDGPPEPGEWTHRSGTIGDFRPHHSATLGAAEGQGWLQLECGQGPRIAFLVATGRDARPGDSVWLPVRYRLDDAAPVGIDALTGGNHLYFRDPQLPSDEDPFVASMARARRLILQIDWSEGDRQTMRFDLSRAGEAIARLRQTCSGS